MTAEEKVHADELLRVMKNTIAMKDSTFTGFNIGMNYGESAGQTVMHAHQPLI
jgi:ATP adenylyltransferase